MEINRRNFIGGALAAVSANARAVVDIGSLGKERMRFGVLSDVHVNIAGVKPHLEKTFRKLDSWRVDGILACGDLADLGLEQELQMLADTWFKVFPGGKSTLDGRNVTNLMHYGDHDMSVSYWNRPEVQKAIPDEETRRRSVIFDNDRKAIWERCFKEPWTPIVHKKVKGYDFVLSHFTRGEPTNKYGHNTPGLEEFFAARAFDPGKPIFYSQHRVMRNTVLGPSAANLDEGRSTKLFSKYPNLIAFCGHCHTSCSNEKNIWQGAFTCIEVPSLSYCCTMGGRENGYCGADRSPPSPPKPAKTMRQHPSGRTHQGMFCIVYERAVVFRRWEFEHDKQIGPDWVVPVESFAMKSCEKPFSYDFRAKNDPVPEFAQGAKIGLSRLKSKDRAGVGHDMIVVEFPPAVNPRANDYEVTVELLQGDVERVLCQKRVFSPRYLYAEEMERENVTCLFTPEEVPYGWTVRYSVRPVNAFGAKGKAIATPFAINRKQPPGAPPLQV